MINQLKSIVSPAFALVIVKDSPGTILLIHHWLGGRLTGVIKIMLPLSTALDATVISPPAQVLPLICPV